MTVFCSRSHAAQWLQGPGLVSNVADYSTETELASKDGVITRIARVSQTNARSEQRRSLVAMWTPDDAGSVGWDDLRKQARRLESELDVKLSSFRRGQQRDGTEEAEIERLLQRLNDVNVQMQTWVSNAGSDVLSHTLARHQNILHELSQEFARIRVSTKAIREHAELLQYFGGADESKSFLDDRDGVQSLLREQATINRSTAQMDTVIGHAQEAYTALRYQRSTFGDISSKIGALGTKMPLVNKVLTAIRRRKSRDTLIIGTVTSLCVIMLLLYWLAK